MTVASRAVAKIERTRRARGGCAEPPQLGEDEEVIAA